MSSNRTLTIRWERKTTPAELYSVLETLAGEYPIRRGKGKGIPVRFVKTGEKGVGRIQRTNSEAIVRYGTPAMALRALSALMAGLVPPGGEMTEKSPFTTFGIMLDCSRNAVMKVEHFKKWLRRLALLGYNMAMLYTEDTYELPGEEYFGYLRGRYTAAELREIDDYAAALGIEMIACIQTLGHLAQILRWPAYADVKDTASVLLVDEKKTYKLIEKMIRHFSRVFRSRRIHIGMDETHDLGRGRFMDRNGFRRGFDLFNDHLGRVVNICKKNGLKPMIWSDMYFRLGSANMDYYDKKCKIPKDAIAKIPKNVELVYWDYYHNTPDFYLDWIKRHRALGFEPLMGSGIWTWYKFWHDQKLTEKNAGACIAACRKVRLNEIFFTLWGDDGGYCDFDSALAGLAFCAEKAYAGSFAETNLAARFRAVCKADYNIQKLAAGLEYAGHEYLNSCILWDDPLLAIILSHKRAKGPKTLDKLEAYYLSLARNLKPHEQDTLAGNIRHARLLAQTMAAKIGLTKRLFAAYSARNRKQLAAVRKEIPGLVRLLEEVADSFRSSWLERNKPFGLEVLQIRIAGLIARYRELDRRLAEYLTGRVRSLPELDANVKVPKGEPAGIQYRNIASGSAIL
ncbi:MAG: family 20 glycosylhydrolase [Kiritimatiellia bacterium]|nr:family 20 glycosylhydrolase [Kiritimatiellia bacterium]